MEDEEFDEDEVDEEEEDQQKDNGKKSSLYDTSVPYSYRKGYTWAGTTANELMAIWQAYRMPSTITAKSKNIVTRSPPSQSRPSSFYVPYEPPLPVS